MPWCIFISRYQVKQLKDSIAQMQVPPAPLDLVETKKTEGMVHNQRLKTHMIDFDAVNIDIFILCSYICSLSRNIWSAYMIGYLHSMICSWFDWCYRKRYFLNTNIRYWGSKFMRATWSTVGYFYPPNCKSLSLMTTVGSHISFVHLYLLWLNSCWSNMTSMTIPIGWSNHGIHRMTLHILSIMSSIFVYI